MRKFLKWAGIIVGSLTALIVVAAVVLAVWKPWAPEIVVADPGSGGERISADGLLANYYPASQPAPGLLVLGGSEGGIAAPVDATARTLQAEGYSVLALSYWGGDGQPERMEDLPLEYFDTAIAWMQQQDAVDPERVGLFGGSKGAEAALLVASRNPAVTAVVANAPSNVAWAGIDMAEVWRMLNIGSTWSANCRPVPYVPYGGQARSSETVEMYRASLEADPAAAEAAAIRIESSTAPIMMVCGEDDTVWPSCDMARAVQQRSQSTGGPDTTVLAYPDAGHMVQGPPVSADSRQYAALDSLGGSTAGNRTALEDSWPQVLDFLTTRLQG